MSPRQAKNADEQKLVRLIARQTFTDEDKESWTAVINKSGLNEDLVKDIRDKLTAIPKGDDKQALKHTQAMMDLNGIVRRWRLSQNLPGNASGTRLKFQKSIRCPLHSSGQMMPVHDYFYTGNIYPLMISIMYPRTRWKTL